MSSSDSDLEVFVPRQIVYNTSDDELFDDRKNLNRQYMDTKQDANEKDTKEESPKTEKLFIPRQIEISTSDEESIVNVTSNSNTISIPTLVVTDTEHTDGELNTPINNYGVNVTSNPQEHMSTLNIDAEHTDGELDAFISEKETSSSLSDPLTTPPVVTDTEHTDGELDAFISEKWKTYISANDKEPESAETEILEQELDSNSNEEEARDSQSSDEPSIVDIEKTIEESKAPEVLVNAVDPKQKKKGRNKKKNSKSRKPKAAKSSKPSEDDILLAELIAENEKRPKPVVNIAYESKPQNPKKKLMRGAIREMIESRKDQGAISKIDRAVWKARREVEKNEAKQQREWLKQNQSGQNNSGQNITGIRLDMDEYEENLLKINNGTGIYNGMFKFAQEKNNQNPNGQETTSPHLTSSMSRFNALTRNLSSDSSSSFAYSSGANSNDTKSNSTKLSHETHNNTNKKSEFNRNEKHYGMRNDPTADLMKEALEANMLTKSIRDGVTDEDIRGFFAAIGLDQNIESAKIRQHSDREVKLAELQPLIVSGTISVESAINMACNEDEDEDVFSKLIRKQTMVELMVELSDFDIDDTEDSNSGEPKITKEECDEIVGESKEKIRKTLKQYFDIIKLDIFEHFMSTPQYLETIVGLRKFEQSLEGENLSRTWLAMCNIVCIRYGSRYRINNQRAGLIGEPAVDFRSETLRERYYEEVLKQYIAETMINRITELDEAGIFAKHDPKTNPVAVCCFQKHIADLFPKTSVLISMNKLIEAGLAPKNAAQFSPFGKELVAYGMFWSYNYNFNLFGSFYRCDRRKDGEHGGYNYYWVIYNRLNENIDDLLLPSMSQVKEPVKLEGDIPVEIDHDGLTSKVTMNIDGMADDRDRMRNEIKQTLIEQIQKEQKEMESEERDNEKFSTGAPKCRSNCGHCRDILGEFNEAIEVSKEIKENEDKNANEAIVNGREKSVGQMIFDGINIDIGYIGVDTIKYPPGQSKMTADNLFARYKNQNPNQDQKDETQKNEAYDGFTQEELCKLVIETDENPTTDKKTLVSAEVDTNNVITKIKISFVTGATELDKMKMLSDILLPSNLKFIKDRAIEQVKRAADKKQ